MDVSTDVQLYFFEARLPGKPTFICGVLLYDEASDIVVFRILENWKSRTDAETAEVLGGYSSYFDQLCFEMGPKTFISNLKNDLHNVLSLSELYSLERPKESLQEYADNLCLVLQVK